MPVLNQSVVLLIEILLVVLWLGLLIPISVLLVECLAAFISPAPAQATPPAPRPAIAVLMPAHNEAIGIGATLKSLLPQLSEQDQLVVIADNCDDETAAIAREFGATAIERQNLEQRGKGFALNFGMDYLAAAPPEVVIMVDADCHVHPGAIDQLAWQAMTTKRPAQAIYLLDQQTSSNAKNGISALAFLVKNLVRPQGLAQLGLPSLLTGTGMAFPWFVIRQVSLAGGNLVEDMQLGVDLAIAGYPPLLCPNALVTGVLPEQTGAATSQRTRWEHGHLKTLLTQVPHLTKAALRQKRWDLLAIALDLSVPPLSLVVLTWIAAGLVTGLALLLGISWLPLGLMALAGLEMFTAIALAWSKFGRSVLPLGMLLTVPLYILWKIPIYLAFLVKPQTQWVRTARDPVEPTAGSRKSL